MHYTTKLLPVLIMGTALSGCSMLDGDNYGNQFGNFASQSQNQLYSGGQSCGPVYQQPRAVYQQAAPVRPVQQSCNPVVPAPQAVAQNFQNSGYTTQGYPGQTAPVQTLPAQRFQAPAYQGQGFQGQTFPAQNYAGGFNQNFGAGAYVPPAFGAVPGGLRGRNRISDSYAYGTLGAVLYDVDSDLFGAQARAGYQFNKFFGVEAEGSFGVSSDSDDLLLNGAVIDQEIEVETSLAGFGVLRYPLFGRLSGLSRIGYHTSDVEQELTDAAGVEVETDFNTDGFAYGTGLEYAVSPRTAIRLDYTVYDFDGPDADAVSLAVSRKF